jgi:hypothetical protein
MYDAVVNVFLLASKCISSRARVAIIIRNSGYSCYFEVFSEKRKATTARKNVLLVIRHRRSLVILV